MNHQVLRLNSCLHEDKPTLLGRRWAAGFGIIAYKTVLVLVQYWLDSSEGPSAMDHIVVLCLNYIPQRSWIQIFLISNHISVYEILTLFAFLYCNLWHSCLSNFSSGPWLRTGGPSSLSLNLVSANLDLNLDFHFFWSSQSISLDKNFLIFWARETSSQASAKTKWDNVYEQFSEHLAQRKYSANLNWIVS